MPELLYRIAQTEDIPSLEKLINNSYRGHESRNGWTNEVDLLEGPRTDAKYLQDLLNQSNSIILVAESESTIVGSVHLSRLDAGKAYLGMLAIKSDWQNRGIGRQLMNAAESWLKKNWKTSTIRMTVIQKRVELIAWYERRGYHRTGETEPFPYGDLSVGKPLIRDMEFVVLEKSHFSVEGLYLA